MRVAAMIALATSTSVSPADAVAATAQRACEAEIARASKRHSVPVNVLYAVGLTETGRKGSLQAYAMNMAGQPFFGRGLDDALAAFEAARRRGVRLIDIGCMQINHHFHASKFSSVRAMFDPAANVDYAARFLVELKAREGSWTMAVARYHAGPNNDPAQKRYVCAVIANMVATGFGAWTAPARAFCSPAR